jgi:acetyl-CoA carboxylase biotin carboxyl carrier protein
MSDSKTSVVGGIVVDTGLVRELAELLDASNLTEIEVKDGDRTIRVARTASTKAASSASAASSGVVNVCRFSSSCGDHQRRCVT